MCLPCISNCYQARWNGSRFIRVDLSRGWLPARPFDLLLILLQVTDNSAIYFYQFTSPKSVNTQWTTRFTIATKDGKTNAPPHALHPDGKPPAWGVGALKDPSKAVGPPVYTTAPATSTKAPVQTPTPGPTPTNVALGVKTGCTAFYTRTADQFCDGITAKFGITLAQVSSP